MTEGQSFSCLSAGCDDPRLCHSFGHCRLLNIDRVGQAEHAITLTVSQWLALMGVVKGHDLPPQSFPALAAAIMRIRDVLLKARHDIGR